MKLQWKISSYPILSGKGFMKGLIIPINGFDNHNRILRVYHFPLFVPLTVSQGLNPENDGVFVCLCVCPQGQRNISL